MKLSQVVLVACVGASTIVSAAPTAARVKRPGKGGGLVQAVQTGIKSLGAASDVAGMAASINSIVTNHQPVDNATTPQRRQISEASNRTASELTSPASNHDASPVVIASSGRRRRHRTEHGYRNKRDSEANYDLLARVVAKGFLSNLTDNYGRREAADPVAARGYNDLLYETRPRIGFVRDPLHSIPHKTETTSDHDSTNPFPRNVVQDSELTTRDIEEFELNLNARDLEDGLDVRGLFGIATSVIKKLIPHAPKVSKVSDRIHPDFHNSNTTKARREFELD